MGFHRATIVLTFASVVFGFHHEVFAEVPKLYSEKTFDSAMLASAVNHCVEVGEVDALREMESIATEYPNGKNGFCINERISWVCRILYTAKNGESLRGPAFGVHMFDYEKFDMNYWPLYPVARVENTYFVLAEGYWGSGEFERLPQYLKYCSNHGVFRDAKIAIPSTKTANRDLARLMVSKRWRKIVWADGKNDGILSSRTWSFIVAQATCSDVRVE